MTRRPTAAAPTPHAATVASAQSRVQRPSTEYRALWLLHVRPALGVGGHAFTPLDPIGDYAGPTLHACRCGAIVPDWALREGSWILTAGHPCRTIVRALPAPRTP